jgi:hypothetical protein
MSSYLDDILIKLAKKQSTDLTIKDQIELDDSISIKKVAFDMYRADSNSTGKLYDGLWTLQEIDGKPHLVRASNPQFDSKKNGDWEVISDYDKRNVTLAYKNIPITRFSSDEYGFSSDDISIFKSALIEKTSSDESFLSELFKEQPRSKKEALVSTFPELKKFI